ncbi:MAG: Ig-like domain-containing protein, partial [Oscillospiraceae bacterium]|nr:Ig-like domain-containing protein [Oscillospiraceae bacterium]
MRRNKIKLLSILLSVAMLLGLFAPVAMATDSTSHIVAWSLQENVLAGTTAGATTFAPYVFTEGSGATTAVVGLSGEGLALARTGRNGGGHGINLNYTAIGLEEGDIIVVNGRIGEGAPSTSASGMITLTAYGPGWSASHVANSGLVNGLAVDTPFEIAATLTEPVWNTIVTGPANHIRIQISGSGGGINQLGFIIDDIQVLREAPDVVDLVNIVLPEELSGEFFDIPVGTIESELRDRLPATLELEVLDVGEEATAIAPVVWNLAAFNPIVGHTEPQVFTITGAVNIEAATLDGEWVMVDNPENLSLSVTVNVRIMPGQLVLSAFVATPNPILFTFAQALEANIDFPALLENVVVNMEFEGVALVLNHDVDIVWDYSGYDFNPAYSGRQEFTLYGTLPSTLPAFVDNPNNVPLVVEITVVVSPPIQFALDPPRTQSHTSSPRAYTLTNAFERLGFAALEVTGLRIHFPSDPGNVVFAVAPVSGPSGNPLIRRVSRSFDPHHDYADVIGSNNYIELQFGQGAPVFTPANITSNNAIFRVDTYWGEYTVMGYSFLDVHGNVIEPNFDEPGEITGVTLDHNDLELVYGLFHLGSRLITAVPQPVGTQSGTLTWMSSDTNIVRISGTGAVSRTIHAVNPGVATITVTSEIGNFSASIEVTVTEQKIVYVGAGRYDIVPADPMWGGGRSFSINAGNLLDEQVLDVEAIRIFAQFSGSGSGGGGISFAGPIVTSGAWPNTARWNFETSSIQSAVPNILMDPPSHLAHTNPDVVRTLTFGRGHGVAGVGSLFTVDNLEAGNAVFNIRMDWGASQMFPFNVTGFEFLDANGDVIAEPTPFTGTNPSHLRNLLATENAVLQTRGNLGIFAHQSPFYVPAGRTLYVETALNIQRDAVLIIEGTVVVLPGGRINNQGSG